MQPNNQTDEIPPDNDTDPVASDDVDRFYILMKTLYSTVDSDESTVLSQYKTRDELRRAIEARAAKVKAILKTHP